MTTRSAPSLQVREIRDALGISRERMARIFDVSAKTIERWEMHDGLPSNRLLRERLAQLQEIVSLGLTVYTPQGFVRFMSTPFRVFDGHTALHLVELGQGEAVFGVLASEYEGLGF